jgi:hypothetical protein
MLSVAKCSKIAVEAVYSANQKYEKWTNGKWLNEAGVEALIQHTLAEMLTDQKAAASHSVDVEVSYVAMRDRSGAPRRSGAPPKLFRSGARADVVMFDSQQRPRVCFEIKRSWIASTGMNDIVRLCTLVDKCGTHVDGSVQAGIFVFFDVKSPRARDASDKEDNRLAEIKETVDAWGLVCRKRDGELWEQEYEEGIWSIRATSFSIEPKIIQS